jgi:hypothetical protein
MTDNSWYERGELPPENTECEIFLAAGWSWCRIVANRGSGSWIVTKSDDIVIRNDLLKFRPIKSDRDRAIDAAITAVSDARLGLLDGNARYFGTLYDAGLLRLPD